MSNFTLMTSLLSSNNEKRTFKSPLFYTFKLFSNNCLGNSVDTYVQCDTFNTEKYKGIPYLDATSVYSKENNSVIINVVNRSKENSINTDIINSTGSFTGKATISEINSSDINAPFTYDEHDKYIPVTKEISVKGNQFNYSFPAHSFTQIIIKVE